MRRRCSGRKTGRCRLTLLRHVGAVVGGLMAAPMSEGDADVSAVGVVRMDVTRAEPAQQILANCEEIRADYQRLKDEIADRSRARFDLSPELLHPGEDVVLAIKARSTVPLQPDAAGVRRLPSGAPDGSRFFPGLEAGSQRNSLHGEVALASAPLRWLSPATETVTSFPTPTTVSA